MNGLDIAKAYYQEIWQPLLQDKYAGYESRIAVGLVGEGSQCYGYDDELSRDHDWGAEIYLWLTADDYKSIGADLQNEFHCLPDHFHGYPCNNVTTLAQGRTGVWEIGAFYRKYLAVPHIPDTWQQWLRIPEDHLSVATNGMVFRDDLGEFSRIRQILQQGYPEDVKKKKLARRLLTMAQAGQYNYPRLLQRNAIVAAQLALDEFMQAAISAVYLLNNKYAPYYKWSYKGLAELPQLGQKMQSCLQELCSSQYSNREKAQTVETICQIVIDELAKKHLSNHNSDFLLEHGYVVHRSISDDTLRQSNPWVEQP